MGGWGGGWVDLLPLLLRDTVDEDGEGVVGSNDEGIEVGLLVHLDGGHACRSGWVGEKIEENEAV